MIHLFDNHIKFQTAPGEYNGKSLTLDWFINYNIITHSHIYTPQSFPTWNSSIRVVNDKLLFNEYYIKVGKAG